MMHRETHGRREGRDMQLVAATVRSTEVPAPAQEDDHPFGVLLHRSRSLDQYDLFNASFTHTRKQSSILI